MKFRNYFLLAGAVLFAACGGNLPETAPTSYQTMTISKSDIVLPLKYSATLKGTSDVTIMPQVSGQLMEVCITEGRQVKKGDVLFRIDSRNAQLELESAEANLLAVQAQESSAKLEYESTKNLFEKGIVSRYMLESAENSYKQAQASVALYKATADRARVNLSYCTITSPVAGVIGSIPVFAGDQVSPGTYLTMVSGNAKMYAEFSVNESVLEERASADIKDNGSALADFPDVTFLFKSGNEYGMKGRITSISGTVDRTTGALTCKATFPNPDGVLYSGIQGTVVIPIEVQGVMVVPQNAVVRLQDKSLVYKVGPDSCAYSAIVSTVGISSGRDLVITSGIEVGDEIVTEGANNVVEGQKVIF
ncbi:MAG: efflux RND transporter periplasmic adaptor subunit [Paludibacteraceae bacterium]|nr:efflux RND transporter periplasmic adaptor subunit [Paludibacteraceae bacterium]